MVTPTHTSYLYVICMNPASLKTKGVQQHLNCVEAQVKASCEAMASREPIAGLPLIPFTKRMSIIGARELGVLLTTGKMSTLASTSGAELASVNAGAISDLAIAKRVRVMVVAEESTKSFEKDAHSHQK